MWTIAPRDGLLAFAEGALFVLAVAAFLLLQEFGLWLRREEHRAWWAGSGRDLLNVLGVLAIGGALRLLGFSWPAALLVGGTVTLLLFGATVFLATQTETRHPRSWALGAGLLVSIPILYFRVELVVALGRVAGALFGPAAS
jgi:hypothetical protein